MQIMKRHAGAIFRGRTRLSWAQRYQFLSGWLPWISDGLGMVVTFIALGWTFMMWAAPRYVYVPMPALSAAALALFLAKTAKTLLLYPNKVGSASRRADGLGRGPVAHPHRGQGDVGGPLHQRQAVLAHAQMRRPGAAQPGAARRVAGDTLLVFGVLAILSVFSTGGLTIPRRCFGS